jgi:NAD(P)-dependent dehydrogenase (short-subunit alcohol dehydrogenase family)
MDLNSLFNLNGRVALVTGGSRGIGKMIVEGYLAAGCSRVYISARKVDQIEATVSEYGDKVIGLPCDLSTVEGCNSLAAQVAEREEKLDILVNNAGAHGALISAQSPMHSGTASWT